MSEPKQYSPEYLADKKLEKRIQQAQRVKVWTAAYAATLGALMTKNEHIAYPEATALLAEQCADLAVLRFDKAWRTE